jgi:hypothetical protein
MNLTPWLPTVRKIKDGENVEQAVVNTPIEQLTQRDQHLYEKFEEISGKSVLISYGQAVHPEDSENLHNGELYAVYYKASSSSESTGGLSLATTGFSASAYSSMYSPKNSNFIFGITKSIYYKNNNSDLTADVYIEGLCEFDVDIDDENYGLIQKVAGGVEEFSVGPYYLSQKSPGKLTKDPSGIPVYVGYAINKRQFLLSSNVDEFSQFFINYRFHVLDRVAGVPVKSSNTWTIEDADITKLGWVPVDELSIDAPETAVFYYNIPGSEQLTADVGLDEFEKQEAAELIKFLPPVPNNFVQLYINGILTRYKDDFDAEGYFSINEYGIWWHTDEDGKQPWSDSYPSNKTPDDWKDTIKPITIADSRKNIFMSSSKFNPALRTQLVSSLKGLNLSTDKSYKFLKLYSKDNLSRESATGDLFFSVEAPSNYYGYKANFTTQDINVLTDDFVYPSVRSADFTADRAVAAIKYSKEDGVFKTAITPIVAKITGSGNLTVTDLGSGVWNISYLSQGLTGFVDSLEPINSRLEFRGLTSYLKLPSPTSATATPYGYIGKITLPSGYPTGRQLNLIFHLFGDTALTSAANSAVAFSFEYAVVGIGDKINLYPDTSITTAQFNLTATTYEAYAAQKIVHASIYIPANKIVSDSCISFKIIREYVSTNSYAGNIGLLGTYWEIV